MPPRRSTNADGVAVDALDAVVLKRDGALTVAAPLEYADLDGNPVGTLQPGDKILIVASDKQDMAQFITPDGTEGVLAISPNYEKGWGLLVDGVSEDECFEYVPYAD